MQTKNWSDCVAQGVDYQLFTNAIHLLQCIGTFACCVSALGQYVPYYRIWYIVNSSTMTILIQCLDWTLVLHSDSLYMGLNSSRPKYQPPSSWITSARHYTQLTVLRQNYTYIPRNYCEIIWRRKIKDTYLTSSNETLTHLTSWKEMLAYLTS